MAQSESGEVEYDDSWRYEVGIAPDRLGELDDYLAELSHGLGQRALWRVAYAGGEGKVVPARAPTKRFVHLETKRLEPCGMAAEQVLRTMIAKRRFWARLHGS